MNVENQAHVGMWLRRHLFQYHLVCVYAETKYNAEFGAVRYIILGCYRVVHVSGVLGREPLKHYIYLYRFSFELSLYNVHR
jgi:hypothetical protein